MSTGFAQERVPTNGIELAVHSAGSGRPIVLCHGWPEIGYSWRHQVGPLVEAGYHVIVPDQRGYGSSDRPEAVADYDILHLSGDLTGLLDHYGYEDAIFAGHDFGAIVVWDLARLQPRRVRGVINLSVPFMVRRAVEPVGFWQERLGSDFYIVHFNRQPGGADAIFDANIENFLRNIYRTDQWKLEVPDDYPGMALVKLATREEPWGTPLLGEEDLAIVVAAFEKSGFRGGLNGYRNFTRNWELMADLEQRVRQPSLMLYGKHDPVPRNPELERYVPKVEVHEFECGHWIQQERPAETNALMLDWLKRNDRD